MTAGAVTLNGVSKRYSGQTVVDDVSVAIAPGEFFTLLGPSGSGKSTTLSMIAGFAVPESGTVMLGGRDMTNAAPRDRGLGMVFQNYAIFPHLNVAENVAFPLRSRGVRGAEVMERVGRALEMVQLAGMGRRHGRELSGGQQQRVALARAIVAEPGIVLMDEPLGALDKNLRYHMQTEIKDIQRRLGMTVIFVTHDQEEAMNMSDRIAIMRHGRIVQMGEPREVYERPDTAFAGRFLGEANLIAGHAAGSMLRTASGSPLKAANTHDGDALLFVRPEKLTLQAPDTPAAPGHNWIEGRVRRSAFLGNVIRTELDIGAGEPLTIDATNGTGATLAVAGEAAAASWPVAESRLLAAEPA